MTTAATSTTAQKAQPTYPIILSLQPLNEGEKFIGVILSADGTYNHYLVLLPGEAEPNKWQAQMEWANFIGGELPDRVESALLFAIMKNEFSPEWYWLREQHAVTAGFAWVQGFGNCTQGFNHKDGEWRARAVRRVTIGKK